MADPKHKRILDRGVQQWNRWRQEHSDVRPDLSGLDLTDRDLKGANLENCNLQHTILRGAKLSKALLTHADLSYADLGGARLRGAYLRDAILRGAILKKANLRYANLAQADVQGADLSGAAVYGIATWNIKGEPVNQADMLLNRSKQPPVLVDNLELAQFLFLLSEHEKLRSVISASTGKLVLLLGGFKEGGLRRLRVVADELKKRSYLPVFFDFERPDQQTYTDTVEILASLSRFVVADLSGPSVPYELATLITHHMIPFILMCQAGHKVFSMARDLSLRSHWVTQPFEYSDDDELGESVYPKIIVPAEEARKEYQRRVAVLYKPQK